jgi:hydroxymethylpyrimidine/phosphomethylpyrimidine kinase
VSAAPHVLSVAGSDPSGGAGIQADLKTFQAFGAYGMAVITSLTAQNTRGVEGIHDVPAEFVSAQIRTLLDDCRVDAGKTGMLKSPEIIAAVAEGLAGALDGRLVVDPVMIATSGDRLIEDRAVASLRRLLFPLAAVVTPNRQETEALTGRPLRGPADARDAGLTILEDGPRAVLVKGVRDGGEFLDVLVTRDGVREYRMPALDVPETHGTGCTFSSAIAAGLAGGRDLADAVARAKDFVWRAIRDAVPVGGGSLPLNHRVPPEARE